MLVREPLNPREASKAQDGFTRQVRASHLGIRHLFHLDSDVVPDMTNRP